MVVPKCLLNHIINISRQKCKLKVGFCGMDWDLP
jgi:hypothetical protein